MALVLVLRAGSGPSGALDDEAIAACERYVPRAAEVQDGRLTGPPLFRLLQDVYNDGQRSDTPDFAGLVTALNTAAINGQADVVKSEGAELERRCRSRLG